MTRKKSKSKIPLFIFLTILIFGIIIFSLLKKHNIGFVMNESLSSDSVKLIEESSSKFGPNLVGIIIVSVDLQKNMRHSKYTLIRDPEVKKYYDEYMNGSVTVEVPFLIGEEVHDARLIRVINHEFVCSPYSETIAYRLKPKTGEKISTVCAIGIPPSYGNFKGIVGIYLKDNPTEFEKDKIRILIKNIAENVSKDLK